MMESVMPKGYIKIESAADSWQISRRRVQALCAAGRIPGALRVGRDWMIPAGSIRPVDGRTKAGRAAPGTEAGADQPLPRKTPFLYMSDLYHTPGTAEACAARLCDHHEAEVLFRAEVAYSRGEIDKVYESASYLLQKHSGFYAILSAGMLLAMCAIWKGDLAMWRRAKVHISEAPAKSDFDRDMMQLAISAVDIMLYNVTSFPDWFKMGSFEALHRDALPAAKVYYAKYLYASAYAVATGTLQMEGVQGLSLMSVLPHALEPLIAWAKSNQTVVSEIYLRMTTAAVYHNSGRDREAVQHIDRAISLALPDRLFGLLAEYCRVMGLLIEERLCRVDEAAWQEVKRLHRIYDEGWAVLGGSVRGKRIVTTLSQKEREVAKLAAFGMSNAQIAEKLHMSLSVVKQAIRVTMEKSGMPRSEFAAIL